MSSTVGTRVQNFVLTKKSDDLPSESELSPRGDFQSPRPSSKSLTTKLPTVVTGMPRSNSSPNLFQRTPSPKKDLATPEVDLYFHYTIPTDDEMIAYLKDEQEINLRSPNRPPSPIEGIKIPPIIRTAIKV